MVLPVLFFLGGAGVLAVTDGVLLVSLMSMWPPQDPHIATVEAEAGGVRHQRVVKPVGCE